MTPIEFIFSLLRTSQLPVSELDRLQGEAQADYATFLVKGRESKVKPIQLAAEHVSKWYVRVALAFLFVVVSKKFMEFVTGATKPASAESDLDEDDEDLFLYDMDDDDDK